MPYTEVGISTLDRETMTSPNQPSHPESLYPPFFQPSSAQNAPLIDYRPDWLVDLLYVRSAYEAAPFLAALAGGPQDSLGLLNAQDTRAFPPEIKRPIDDLQVSHRRIARTITGQAIGIYTLYGIEQNAKTKGFNDAVYLHVRLETGVVFNRSVPSFFQVSREGVLTVGRLDVLYACLLCFQNNPDALDLSKNSVLSLFLPAAPIEGLKQGNGVALIYPMTDLKGLQSLGNQHIVMRICYDVLAKLQGDLREEGIRHPFTTVSLPVPNRRRIELELQGDGYDIKGDVAVRRRQVNPDQDMTFLNHIRRLLPGMWDQERVVLPPQAAPEDYLRIGRDALNVAAQPMDREVFRIVLGWMSAQGPEKQAATPAPSTPPAPPMPRPTPPRPTTLPPSAPAPKKQSSKNWADDFAVPIAQPKPENKSTNWADDFNTSPDERISLNRSDWAADFDAGEDHQ